MDADLTTLRSRFRFATAEPQDEAELRALGRRIEMPGIIRMTLDREPDYFNALRVEGRHTEVHVCRETRSGRIVGCGHRSSKPVYVNGLPTAMGYLSALRLDESARGGLVLARAYAYLHRCHGDGRVPCYLTSIMEDNAGAGELLTSGRAGLPVYLDRGRYETMAVGLDLKLPAAGSGCCQVRPACAADAAGVLEFLAREGSRRQFYPVYRAEDFGAAGNLLYGLAWQDVFLAFQDGRLVGVAAAWDQRRFRQWRITGYSPLLRALRRPLNLWASFNGMPKLPKAGEAMRYFTLALNCVAGDDPAVFSDLLLDIIRTRKGRFDFFLAGMHETDPLLPRLDSLPHLSLRGRLHLVAWPDGVETLSRLETARIP